jgi:hypothetical protein
VNFEGAAAALVDSRRRGPGGGGGGLLLFITAVPITKLCAWGEEDSGGHVL